VNFISSLLFAAKLSFRFLVLHFYQTIALAMLFKKRFTIKQKPNFSLKYQRTKRIHLTDFQSGCKDKNILGCGTISYH
jgi:hypothetical protein